jgi:PAS domain S-box-containing protein
MNYNDAAGLAQALFHEAGDALFLFDPDTDALLDVNPMAERLTGFPRRELLQMPATYWFRFGGQGGLQRLRKAASKTGAFHSQEGFFLRTRQDRVWIPVNLTTTRLHVQPKTLALITARDIREQREALIHLQEAEAELRRVIVAVSDCLWSAVVAGPNQWAYRYLSPVVEKIAGRAPAFFLAGIDRWRTIVHPDDLPRWEQALVRMRAGQSSQEEYRILRPDQALCWVRESVAVSRAGTGAALRLDGVLADITERKRRDEQIRALNADLERRVQERTHELEAANRELEAFCYSVSHDLRAPLRSIDGFSQAMLEDYGDQLGPNASNHLQRVRAATQRMGQLIDDLLKLSRLTRSEMRREPVNLSALARTVAAELQQREPRRQVTLTIAEGLTATGDPQLLRIALENLLGNSWKFTSKHAQARIEFGKLERADRPVYFVRDDGAGFDMAYAGKLFGAFQRLHTRADFPGTGIGLATVQRVIHRHGGRLWAEGQVEKGATFYFTL